MSNLLDICIYIHDIHVLIMCLLFVLYLYDNRRPWGRIVPANRASLYKVYLFIYSAKTGKIKSQHICNNTMICYQKYTYQIW